MAFSARCPGFFSNKLTEDRKTLWGNWGTCERTPRRAHPVTRMRSAEVVTGRMLQATASPAKRRIRRRIIPLRFGITDRSPGAMTPAATR